MPVTNSTQILKLKMGDHTEWEAFVTEWQPWIRRIVQQSGLNLADAEDVVQDVLLQFFRILPRFQYDRQKGGLRSWLKTVARKKICDRYRLRQKQASSLTHPDEIPERDETRQQQEDEQLKLVEFALTSAQSEFRRKTWECFFSHVLLGRSAMDVARELSTSENAVYVNSSRVLNHIRMICRTAGESMS